MNHKRYRYLTNITDARNSWMVGKDSARGNDRLVNAVFGIENRTRFNAIVKIF